MCDYLMCTISELQCVPSRISILNRSWRYFTFRKINNLIYHFVSRRKKYSLPTWSAAALGPLIVQHPARVSGPTDPFTPPLPPTDPPTLPLPPTPWLGVAPMGYVREVHPLRQRFSSWGNIWAEIDFWKWIKQKYILNLGKSVPVTTKDMQTPSPPPQKSPSWHKRCPMCY